MERRVTDPIWEFFFSNMELSNEMIELADSFPASRFSNENQDTEYRWTMKQKNKDIQQTTLVVTRPSRYLGI